MKHKSRSIIEYRDYDMDNDFPILLLTGDKWHISDIRSSVLHFHNCLEIGICHSDSGFMEFGDTVQPFKAGDVTFVSKNVSHTTYSSPGESSLWSYIFLLPDKLLSNYIKTQFPHEASFREMLDNICVILDPAQYPEFQTIVKQLITELSECSSNYKYAVSGLVLALMMKLLRIFRTDRSLLTLHKANSEQPIVAHKNALAIQPALLHIHEHYMQNINITELTDLCQLSQTHFRRIFHDVMGCSPLDYLNSYRIKQACINLRLTNESILNIALQVGFHTISSFNRQFLAIVGITPSEYRKTLIPEKKIVHQYTGWMSAEVPKN
jgi:AraC-like DNA-binding protein